jgi:hypothetical protein
MDGRDWLLAASVAAAVFSSSEALAYRPFDSTDADVAKPLELELEFGPSDYLVVGKLSWLAPTLVVNFGVVPGVELVLEGSNLFGSARPAGPRDYRCRQRRFRSRQCCGMAAFRTVPV